MTTVYKVIDDELASDVDEYVSSNSNGHFKQTGSWAQQHGNTLLVIPSRDSAIAATAAVDITKSRLPGLSQAQIERGPITGETDTMASLLRACSDSLPTSVASLRVSPLRSSTNSAELRELLLATGFSPVPVHSTYSYNATVVVDIEATAELQWRTLRRAHRTSINRARRAELFVTNSNTLTDLQEFPRHYNNFAKSRGLRLLNAGCASALANLAKGSDFRVQLLSAHQNDVMLGQILLVGNTQRVCYEWGWTTSPAEGRLPLTHLLLWHGLEWARENGIEQLDLGGYWLERGNSDPNNHFKLGFSKQIEEFVPEHRKVLSGWRDAYARGAARLRRGGKGTK